MKMLLVSQYFWPESFSINALARSLSDRNVEVTVLTGKPNYPEGNIFAGYAAMGHAEEVYGNMRVLRVPLFPRGHKSAFRLALNYLSFIVSGALWGSWMLRRAKPEVVFVYAPSPLLQALPALLLARLKGCPLVLWVQDLWPDSLEATGYVRNHLALTLVGWVVRFIYRHTDLILVSSQPFAETIACLAPDSRIVYHPNSVDEVFHNPYGGSQPGLPALDEGFSVVFAGNVGAAQAMDVIVEAATLLAVYREIRFVILGSGSQFEWVSQQVLKRGLTNLHLAGRFPVDAMPHLLSKASVLLVTLADRPIFAATVPNKIQAYMAVGRPIVACLNGEGARLVEEAGAGLAVPAEDASGLADAVLKLYRMLPEEREQLGTNGRVFYLKQFDHSKLVTDLIRHLQNAIEEKVRRD
jgi:glycosyltransferase involved in cell wall biosynthesis